MLIQKGELKGSWAEELLIGFDLRLKDHSERWTLQRRDDFLFRTDVGLPYSVDTTVWPSIFESGERPAHCIGHQDSWNDLECLRSHSSNITSGLFIAITLHGDSQILNQWRSATPLTNPQERDEAWGFLGYDVADRWLLSGLGNCGFLDTEDVRDLKMEWGPKLNEHHLFENLEQARLFTELSDKRVSEHSPFFIFGLWSLKNTPAA